VSSKPILSLIAALALSVAGSTVARAQSTPSDEAGSQSAGSQTNDSQTKDSTKKTKKKPKKHPGMTKLDKLERGNPNSVYYKSRKKHAPNPTNAQIDATETGNPASVDYDDRKISPHNPTNAEINAAETGNPASVDYGKDPKEVLKEKWRRDRLRPKLGAGRSGAGRGRGVEFRSEFVGRPTRGSGLRQRREGGKEDPRAPGRSRRAVARGQIPAIPVLATFWNRADPAQGASALSALSGANCSTMSSCLARASSAPRRGVSPLLQRGSATSGLAPATACCASTARG